MSNISTASTAVWSRSTEAAEQAECTSGNITNVDACAGTLSNLNKTKRHQQPGCTQHLHLDSLTEQASNGDLWIKHRSYSQ